VIYLVSRHPGALDWMRRRATGATFKRLAHLDSHFAPEPGDQVCGVLPLFWVERINRAGAEAWVLEVDVPAPLRGQELSAEQLEGLQARLVRYDVRALDFRQ